MVQIAITANLAKSNYNIGPLFSFLKWILTKNCLLFRVAKEFPKRLFLDLTLTEKHILFITLLYVNCQPLKIISSVNELFRTMNFVPDMKEFVKILWIFYFISKRKSYKKVPN